MKPRKESNPPADSEPTTHDHETEAMDVSDVADPSTKSDQIEEMEVVADPESDSSLATENPGEKDPVSGSENLDKTEASAKTDASSKDQESSLATENSEEMEVSAKEKDSASGSEDLEKTEVPAGHDDSSEGNDSSQSAESLEKPEVVAEPVASPKDPGSASAVENLETVQKTSDEAEEADSVPENSLSCPADEEDAEVAAAGENEESTEKIQTEEKTESVPDLSIVSHSVEPVDVDEESGKPEPEVDQEIRSEAGNVSENLISNNHVDAASDAKEDQVLPVEDVTGIITDTTIYKFHVTEINRKKIGDKLVPLIALTCKKIR